MNGEPRRAGPRTTVAELLERLGIPPERIAVEINRELLPRDRFGRPLAPGDRLEIVTFVGGG